MEKQIKVSKLSKLKNIKKRNFKTLKEEYLSKIPKFMWIICRRREKFKYSKSLYKQGIAFLKSDISKCQNNSNIFLSYRFNE